MTIDEAIQCERENARLLLDRMDLLSNSEYHNQIANWLEELKTLREIRDTSN